MLIAGCPASGREWACDQWVGHLVTAMDFAGRNDLIIYMLVPHDDEPTAEAIGEACSLHHVELILERSDEPMIKGRDWTTLGRYEQIMKARNVMLVTIREMAPDLFLSIDSDIMIGVHVLDGLIHDLDRFDAVAGKLWLSLDNDDIVNYGMILPGGGMNRGNYDGCFPVDVIMALKLMTPKAYWIDYEYDQRGEDLGWSRNAKAAGLRLGWDGSLISKHIMYPDLIDKFDKRVGW